MHDPAAGAGFEPTDAALEVVILHTQAANFVEDAAEPILLITARLVILGAHTVSFSNAPLESGHGYTPTGSGVLDALAGR